MVSTFKLTPIVISKSMLISCPLSSEIMIFGVIIIVGKDWFQTVVITITEIMIMLLLIVQSMFNGLMTKILSIFITISIILLIMDIKQNIIIRLGLIRQSEVLH